MATRKKKTKGKSKKAKAAGKSRKAKAAGKPRKAKAPAVRKASSGKKTTRKKTSVKKVKAHQKAKAMKKTKTKTKIATKARTKPSQKASASKTATVKKRKAVKSKLTSVELKELSEILLQKRALILGDLSSMGSSALRASEQDASVDHLADHGTDNYEQDFTLSLMENVGSVVKQIDDALERIEDKTFGLCQECGCSIPKARLRAIPYAQHCVDCQSKLENF